MTTNTTTRMTEATLTSWLAATIIPDIRNPEPDNEYCVLDRVSDVYGMYMELKCRDKHYTQLLIEKHKWCGVREKAQAKGYRAIYICWTPIRGGTVYVFDLDKLTEPVWEERNLPATTQFANRRWRKKTVGYLSVDDAVTKYVVGDTSS